MTCDYRLLLSKRANQAIKATESYLKTVLLSQAAAQRAVRSIFDGLNRLLLFPESGFDTDQRYGKRINPEFETKALVMDKYIAFYFVDEETGVIFVTHIFSSQSDYVKLLSL